MATRVNFISSNVLKNLYVLDTNIDEKILEACIFIAQEYFIFRLLGSNLYKRIWSDIENNLNNSDIKKLLDDYINKCLIHYAMYELYKHLSFRLTNKGVVQKDSEQSTTIDYDTLMKLRDDEMHMGNYLAEQMIKYLCANPSKYPEFTMTSSVEDILPTLSSYGKIGYGYDDFNFCHTDCC